MVDEAPFFFEHMVDEADRFGSHQALNSQVSHVSYMFFTLWSIDFVFMKKV
jgi:hypothetical protein